MRLTQLIKSLGVYHTECTLKDFNVKGISCNSKEVLANYIFVAIKGNNKDGHKFIASAIKQGAGAVVIEKSALKDYKKSAQVCFIAVLDTRKVLARLAAGFYGNPSSKIKIIGITGTNGKTTVTYLIEAILKKAGFLPAVIGTINYRFKNKIFTAKNTTPGPVELQGMFSDMLKEDIDYVAMEVSSHALDQNRTEEINFHSAIFTNLTHDHLDYHKTLENYFQAKAKLFKNIGKDSFVVINNDDAYGRRLKRLTSARIITYGILRQADIVAKDIKFDVSHTEFRLMNGKVKIDITSRLIGRHNVYNILAAASWALAEGLNLSIIKSEIEKFSSVPGRLERIDNKGGFFIFVDYAHTEDALHNVISTLRQLPCKRIIVVFGCGGNRDKIKRPKMGYVVTELADLAIITNDNPRQEDPLEIIKEIKKGIIRANYTVIADRKKAIIKALSLAKPGDIVLVAGKGHENYQILKGKAIPFDDRQVVRECLKSLNY